MAGGTRILKLGCRWPGPCYSWPAQADGDHREPNTWWLSEYHSPNCTCCILNVFSHISNCKMCAFESISDVINVLRVEWMVAVNQTFVPCQKHARKACYIKECEVTANWTKHLKKVLATLTIKYFDNDIVVCCVVITWLTKNLVLLINGHRDRNHLKLIDITNANFRNPESPWVRTRLKLCFYGSKLSNS